MFTNHTFEERDFLLRNAVRNTQDNVSVVYIQVILHEAMLQRQMREN